MPDTPVPPNPFREPTFGFTLEWQQRFSKSLLWKIAKAYYGKLGPQAFNPGRVPNYVTNNSFVARAYAKVILGFLRDCATAGAIDPSHPVYIVEVGAGAGRLTYGVLHNLRQMLDCSSLQQLRLKAILTDLSDSNRAFWRQHWRLMPLIESGVVDTARFNVEEDSSIALEHSGETISAGTIRNPVIVMANYIFGSVPHDLFWVGGDGVLQESLSTIRASEENIDWAKPDLLKDIDLEYTRRPVDENYYPQAAWNQLLHRCRRELSEKVISFPTAALSCIDNLAKLSGSRFLLLTADKGYHHEQISFNVEPPLAVHSSFSAFVNYRAIALYFEQLGGSAFATSYAAKALDTCAFALLPNVHLVETAMAFDESISSLNPRDFVLLIRALEEAGELTVDEFVALLRFSNYDSFVVWTHTAKVAPKVPLAENEIKHQLLTAIERVWDGFYPGSEIQDIPLCLGTLAIVLEQYAYGLHFLMKSIDMYGPTAQNTHQAALCHFTQGDLDAAAEYARKALSIKPEQAPSQELLHEIARLRAAR